MQTHILIKNSRTVRHLYKRVPLAGGGEGFTTEGDGREEISYETRIDYRVLDDMARRAAASKGGKCTSGPLIVRVIERRRL